MLFNLLDTAESTATESFDLWQIIFWYSVFAILVIILVLYLVKRGGNYKGFKKAQEKLGREYTELGKTKNMPVRITKTYKVLNKVLTELILVKEKTSLPDAEDAIAYTKKLMNKISNMNAIKKGEQEEFIKEIGKLNSKLGEIYLLIKK